MSGQYPTCYRNMDLRKKKKQREEENSFNWYAFIIYFALFAQINVEN